MLKIRLQRIGRKNDPSFRVVVTEHTRGPKSEKHVDRVGFYNPKTKEQNLEENKIKEWIAKGAQASGTVHNMLVKSGIIKADTINVLPQKNPVVKEEETKQEAAPTVEAADSGKETLTTEESTLEEEPVVSDKTSAVEEREEETQAEETSAEEETPAEAQEEKKEA
ncbi:30S ribosomal protein S16 [bacterium]|nr:30S ribosomal protein S16 [bacterium]|tara:strand:+ start:260 stop:757 length:498 start_codon:yes stop_codon:yes gene_type:complete